MRHQPRRRLPVPEPERADAEERPGRLRRLGRTVGVAGGGVALLGALAVGLLPTQTFLDQRASTAEAAERLAVLQAQNEAFEARIERLDTKDEIERVAREQYNYAYPGEETYVILPAPLPPLDMSALWPFGEVLDHVATAAEVDAELDEAP